MAGFVYVLCAIASMVSTLLLFRAYLKTKRKLLLWSSICFLGLTLNNVMLFFDFVLAPDMNLGPYRLGTAIIGMGFLLYGLIWEAL